MAELEHRVKNMLAVVTAVIERAREDTQSKEQFVASLRGRIHSMASAQALLSESRWRGVNLTSLIRAELAPYATATNTNLDGPTIHLRPEATHAVAMVMHELATNAAKYGALSQPDGQVSVRWRLAAKPPAGSVLEIQWEETGGPAVTGPERQGYGSGVVRDLLSYELGGKVDLSLRLLVFAAASNCPPGRSLKRSADLAVAVVQRESCDDTCRLCWGSRRRGWRLRDASAVALRARELRLGCSVRSAAQGHPCAREEPTAKGVRILLRTASMVRAFNPCSTGANFGAMELGGAASAVVAAETGGTYVSSPITCHVANRTAFVPNPNNAQRPGQARACARNHRPRGGGRLCR